MRNFVLWTPLNGASTTPVVRHAHLALEIEWRLRMDEVTNWRMMPHGVAYMMWRWPDSLEIQPRPSNSWRHSFGRAE